MLLEHALKNTGQQGDEGNVYNHNFFVIDHQATGPDFSIKFPSGSQGPARCRIWRKFAGTRSHI